MGAAPQLGVASYKPDTISQVQPRGMSMMVSGDTAVPYGAVMPQLTTLQVGKFIINNDIMLITHPAFYFVSLIWPTFQLIRSKSKEP